MIDFNAHVPPTPEALRRLYHDAQSESDRGVAIMGSALVEQALEAALRRTLSHLQENELDKWFMGSLAPFRSFDAKIKLGRGIMKYQEDAEGRLTIIRKIRNIFAHYSGPITFDHPQLQNLNASLLYSVADYKMPTKIKFTAYCASTCALLMGFDTETILVA